MALSDMRLGRGETVCSLTVHRSPAETFQVAVRRTIRPYDLTEQRPEPLSELSAGVYYIDLTRVSEREFLDSIPRLSSARGIVLDLRGYPHLPPLILQHIATGIVLSPRFAVPIVVRPDRSAMQYENSQWTLKPQEPHIGARVVCLIDTRAVSQSETWLSMIAQERLAVLVGEPSAGTNGDINLIRLPSSIRMLWTGLEVSNQGGSPHYGIGIVPDRLIRRTVAGIREGRDEILEAGLTEVSAEPRAVKGSADNGTPTSRRELGETRDWHPTLADANPRE
jgi:C-terminal processing protease CtpA/Prc